MTRAEEVLTLLREMFEADPVATNALFMRRVSCNQALADHPTIECDLAYYPGDRPYELSALGVLNGLIPREEGRVAAIVDVHDINSALTHSIVGFTIVSDAEVRG